MILRTLTISLLFCGLSDADQFVNPVILMPGDGGSQVQGRLNKTSGPHYICFKTSDWFDLWLSIELMVPAMIDCWADNMRLEYDNQTRSTRNPDGIEIRIPGFGNTSTVEFLDVSLPSYTGYFAKVVSKLLTLGYKRGINIHGAPYDFRKAANEHDQFFADLKQLIESTYKANGNKPVIFICHSMGSPMTLYFLNKQSQSWKDKYVKAMITMAGVWGGTVRAVKVYAVGDNLGYFLVSQSSLRIQQRSTSSLAWLMPSSRLWKDDEVLVQAQDVNVTVKNFDIFYEKLNHTEGKMMHEDVRDLIYDLTPPGVDVYCLHSSSVPTTEKLVYSGKFAGSTPTLITGDGDGTVNIRSLMACTDWDGKQKGKHFHHKVFPHVDHLQMLSNEVPVEYVKNIVQSILKNDQHILEEADNEIMEPQIDIVV